MDGRDVWNHLPLARAEEPARDKTIVNRIMLRFRPIAPKPVAGGSVPGGPATVLLGGKRAKKRKYVRVRRNSGCRRQNKEGLEKTVATLQLMPEKAEEEGGSMDLSSRCDVTEEKREIPENPGEEDGGERSSTSDRRVVESWVTVESVGDTCMEVGELGSTDVEKVKNLETDTCPGFISDGSGRVRWVNEAYKRMMIVGSEKERSPEEIVVRLRVKDNVVYSYGAFTCGVRLEYTCHKEKWTKMVPCDVWRLGCGGLAWRLDIKAALSLGL